MNLGPSGWQSGDLTNCANLAHMKCKIKLVTVGVMHCILLCCVVYGSRVKCMVWYGTCTVWYGLCPWYGITTATIIIISTVCTSFVSYKFS